MYSQNPKNDRQTDRWVTWSAGTDLAEGLQGASSGVADGVESLAGQVQEAGTGIMDRFGGFMNLQQVRGCCPVTGRSVLIVCMRVHGYGMHSLGPTGCYLLFALLIVPDCLQAQARACVSAPYLLVYLMSALIATADCRSSARNCSLEHWTGCRAQTLRPWLKSWGRQPAASDTSSLTLLPE